jgi:hypothetical protein
VKSRISAKSWSARVQAARRDEKILKRIVRRVKAGDTLNRAIAKVVKPSKRSWVMRRWRKYCKRGFEALIDARTPREPKLSSACRGVIHAAREANPNLTVAEMVDILRAQRLEPLPTERLIRREFTKVDRRLRRTKAKRVEQVVELPFAGGELLLAAEMETNGIAALTNEVKTLGEEALRASKGRTPVRDVAHRDENGHFTVTYNRKRRRKRNEEIASYLRSAAEKAEGRVPSWPRFVHESQRTLEPKLRMLVFAPLVSQTKGWNALRAAEAAGLAPLTGFAHMPSTLAKLTSALAVSGAGQRLLERVGQHWHGVAQEHWGEAGAMAALYVDNHAKEVWSSLFTRSGKVSHLNRVMPCITTTYIHTGAGTPMAASVQSGGAPLAPRLATLVKKAEALLEGDVRRAVIIDAEGSTFDILESFAKHGRVIITPLRPSRAPALELRYSPGSYFRPYREKDELRVATASLLHKSTGRSLDIGALLVRREHRESDTVLLTTGLALGMEGRDLADLYFSRWPIQENAFKEGAAVGLDKHRGNCGRMVNNIAVVTELERIQRRIATDEKKRRSESRKTKPLERDLEQKRREHQRAISALGTRRRRLDGIVAQGRHEGKQLGHAAVEHQQALTHAETAQREFDRAQQQLKAHHARLSQLEMTLSKLAKRREQLEPQRRIRQLDVAQDSILTAMKLTALQLIAFALREYLPSLPMTTQTFVSRVFSIRGHRVLRPEQELVVFHENARDPEMSAVLRHACARLNSRSLRRNGRLVQYVVGGEATR